MDIEKIKQTLDNAYWLKDSDKFENSSDYRGFFEQKFGNISRTSIIFDNIKIKNDKMKPFLSFMEEWRFTSTIQTDILKLKKNVFFHDDLKIMMDISVDKSDDLSSSDQDDFVISMDDSLNITFSPLKQNRQKIEQFLDQFLSSDFLNVLDSNKKFYMISSSGGSLYKQQTSFKNLPIKDERYDVYYGDKFPHEKLEKFITDETENLLLLHGDPGTGKSNYIKNLITKSQKDVIYVPPSMLNIISSPEFISFIMENKNNILLIEDAEEILSSERTSATNNLLGLTDGFLKDALNLKVICTFNCDLSKIDPALMRKGRLYFQYKFDKLTKDEGQRLADFVGIDAQINTEMGLAEIFNFGKENHIEDDDSFQERKIGFFS